MISTVEQFRGQARVRSLLAAYLAQGRLCGTLLLLGQRGLGKTTLATIIARALTCERNPAKAGLWFCGECYACRSIAAGQQAEYTVVRPLGTEIKAEQMDEDSGALYGFSLHPVNLSHRILVIDDAHCLNEKTSNQLLKLLEEPPERSVFILVTDKEPQSTHTFDTQGVLPTIASRATPFRLTPLTRQELAGYIAADVPGVDPAAVQQAAYISGGRYVDAVALARSPEWCSAVLHLAERILRGQRIPDAAAQVADFEYEALWRKLLADSGLDEALALKQLSDSYKPGKDDPPRSITKELRNELRRQALISAYERAAWWLVRPRGQATSAPVLPRAGLSAALAALKARVNGNVDLNLAQVAFEVELRR